VEPVETVQQRRIDTPEAAVVREEECAAARYRPCPGHGRQAGHCVHGAWAIARAREAEASANEAPLDAAIETRELDDLLDVKPSDRRSPLRSARAYVLFDLNVEIREPGEICAIDHALVEQHVHDGERQRAAPAPYPPARSSACGRHRPRRAWCHAPCGREPRAS